MPLFSDFNFSSALDKLCWTVGRDAGFPSGQKNLGTSFPTRANGRLLLFPEGGTADTGAAALRIGLVTIADSEGCCKQVKNSVLFLQAITRFPFKHTLLWRGINVRIKRISTSQRLDPSQCQILSCKVKPFASYTGRSKYCQSGVNRNVVRVNCDAVLLQARNNEQSRQRELIETLGLNSPPEKSS